MSLLFNIGHFPINVLFRDFILYFSNPIKLIFILLLLLLLLLL